MFFVSLIFGLAAWIIAALGIKPVLKNSAGVLAASFSSAAISVLAQFFEFRRRINADDFAGLDDTFGITMFGLVVMMAVTIILNSIAVLNNRRE